MKSQYAKVGRSYPKTTVTAIKQETEKKTEKSDNPVMINELFLFSNCIYGIGN